MTEQEIINSQAFKMLNHLIDTKVSQMIGYMHMFKDRVNQSFESNFEPDINVRVSYERCDERYAKLPASALELKGSQWLLDMITRLDEEIRELSRVKLQLLNDYDFTHGDNSLAVKFFGEENGANS